MFTYLCLSCEFLREKLHAFKEKKKFLAVLQFTGF